MFATLQWSPDETKIVYIAEKKIIKSEPFYRQKLQKSDDKETTEISSIPVFILINCTTIYGYLYNYRY